MEQNRRGRKTEKKSSSKALKVVLIVLLDTALLAASLLTFAYFHHVKPDTSTVEPIIIERPAETPAPTAEPADTSNETEVEPEPTEAPPLTWKEIFADKFTDGEVIHTDNSYISENTHITVTRHETTVEKPYNGEMVEYPLVYYVADIYITDVEQMQATFASGEYMPGAAASTQMQVTKNKGLVGINGDNYGSRQVGLVIRNGALYRQSLYEGDVLVLNYDGTMEAYFYSEVNLDTIVANAPFQAWSFGPIFVKDGQKVISPQQSDYIDKDNPRTAIGYYEPGHYCMVVIEGRSDDSVGADMDNLSNIFIELGCQIGYNLDGGGTSAMVFNDQYVNVRAGGGRHGNDSIIITDPNYKAGE